MEKAIFLDRDGTINTDKGHLYKIEDFQFIPGTANAIKIWNEMNYFVLVVTNQSGVARGLYTENDVCILHNYINDELKKLNAHIDNFYYCPHHPTEGKGIYLQDCDCRKPKSGMLERAIREFNIDTTQSYLFGDKATDLETGRRLNIKSFLVNGVTFNVNDYEMFKIN